MLNPHLPGLLLSEHPNMAVQCCTYSASPSHTKTHVRSLNVFALLRIFWSSAVPHESLFIIRDRWCEALSMFLSHLAADDDELLIHPFNYVDRDFSKEAKGVRWQDQWISVGAQHQYYTHILYSLVCRNQTAILQANSYRLCHRLQVLDLQTTHDSYIDHTQHRNLKRQLLLISKSWGEQGSNFSWASQCQMKGCQNKQHHHTWGSYSKLNESLDHVYPSVFSIFILSSLGKRSGELIQPGKIGSTEI